MNAWNSNYPEGVTDKTINDYWGESERTPEEIEAEELRIAKEEAEFEDYCLAKKEMEK